MDLNSSLIDADSWYGHACVVIMLRDQIDYEEFRRHGQKQSGVAVALNLEHPTGSWQINRSLKGAGGRLAIEGAWLNGKSKRSLFTLDFSLENLSLYATVWRAQG